LAVTHLEREKETEKEKEKAFSLRRMKRIMKIKMRRMK
jgi:hypothetical protein